MGRAAQCAGVAAGADVLLQYGAAYYALVFSLPQVLRQLTGLEVGRVGFLIAAMGVAGAVAMLVVAIFSDRSKKRVRYTLPGIALMGGMVLAAGLQECLEQKHGRAGERRWHLLGVLVVYYGIQGPLQAMMSEVEHGAARAVAIAGGGQHVLAIFGGFFGALLDGMDARARGRLWAGDCGAGVGPTCSRCVFLPWSFSWSGRRRIRMQSPVMMQEQSWIGWRGRCAD